MAGVSVRTLHHYDEIALLVPSRRTPAGYRRYTGTDLERLQEVLLYRGLGMGLAEIAATIDDVGHDRRSALLHHRALLQQRLEALGGVLALVDRTLMTMQGVESDE